MKSRWFLLAFLLIMSACAERNDQKSSTYALNYTTETKLVGEWENVSLYVEIKNPGNAEILEVTETNWEEKMNTKPVRTEFYDNHTYRATYRDIHDSIIRVAEGTWEVMGDSLFMDQTRPEWVSYVYKYSVANDLATLESTLDWDGDGQENDSYIGILRRQYR